MFFNTANMKAVSTNTRILFGLVLILLLLSGFDYLQAWTTAPQNPPNGNVAAPVNTSGVSQIKTGSLGTGNLSVTGLQKITHFNPILSFIDTDTNQNDYRIVVNGNGMWFQTDRDNSGTFGPYGPTGADGRQTLVLHSSTTSSGDYALFSSQVRADAYCDRGGNNCSTPGGSPTLPTCQPGEVLVAQSGGNWACGPNFEQCHRFVTQYGNNGPITFIRDSSINVTHIAMIGNYNSGYGTLDESIYSGGWNSDYHNWGYFAGRTDSYVQSTLIPVNTWANVSNGQPKTISMVGPNGVTMRLSYSIGSCN